MIWFGMIGQKNARGYLEQIYRIRLRGRRPQRLFSCLQHKENPFSAASRALRRMACRTGSGPGAFQASRPRI